MGLIFQNVAKPKFAKSKEIVFWKYNTEKKIVIDKHEFLTAN